MAIWTKSDIIKNILQEIKLYEGYQALPSNLKHLRNKEWLKNQHKKQLEGIWWMLRDDVWRLEQDKKRGFRR